MADGASGKRMLELARQEDSFTRDEVNAAAELLKLKEHEQPEGFVGFQGTPFVRVGSTLLERLRNAATVDEARAACVLILDQCGEAEWLREEEIKSDEYEMGPAVAGVVP